MTSSDSETEPTDPHPTETEIVGTGEIAGTETDEIDADVIETQLADGQLAYDCAAWAGESRALLTSLLATSGIAHAWQGTTLTIHDDDEEAVDDLVDEVLVSAAPALDPDVPKVIYEVGGWPVALQTELAQGLTASDVPYEWDEQGDLVVRASDEETVATVLDELPEPDDDAVSSDDGVALHELLDSVFLSTARLAKHPADASATVTLIDAADLLARVALPFGFEPAEWRRLVGEVTDLSRLIDPTADGGDGGNRTDDTDPSDAADEEFSPATIDAEISQQALVVRDRIRQYI